MDLFERVIRGWQRRPDPTEALTLQQIAHLALGSGTATNAARVGRVMNEFRVYFHAPGGMARKWRVNWMRVEKDYPDLVRPRPGPRPTPATPASALAGMTQALNDEILAVRREMETHPIVAIAAVEAGTDDDGSFLYEAIIDLPGDSELPIPEGVGIWLRWSGGIDPSVLEATLLAYDPLLSRVIFEVDQPLPLAHRSREFRLLPRVDELIEAILAKMSVVRSTTDALSLRLLVEPLEPQARPWSGPVTSLGLDADQLASVRACLTQDITFVWGPPGTGKTHTLARLIANAALGGHRVLGTAIANVAVDQLARQVVHALDDAGPAGVHLLDSGQVMRFGHPRIPDVTGERRLFPHKEETQRLRTLLHEALEQLRSTRDLQRRALKQREIKNLRAEIRRVTKEFLEGARVVLTTAVQVCLEPALSESIFNMSVADEASMMPIPHLICVGALAQDRFVVAGDFRQLGPIALSRSRASFDWLHRDAFALLGLTPQVSHRAMTMLTLQRRMHQDICDMINRPFYNGALRTQVTAERVRAIRLPPLPGKAVTLVEVLPEDGSIVEQTEGGSRRNPGSARAVMRVLNDLTSADRTAQIGVITPYRAQVSLIKRRIRETDLASLLDKSIRVGTVHAFQGSEADVIVWDLVDTRTHPIGKLYRGDTGDRLVNVAISRAQGKLIVVGDPDAFFRAPGADATGRFRVMLQSRFSLNLQNVVRPDPEGLSDPILRSERIGTTSS